MQHIAIITTHPIQYNAPLFKYLSESGEFNLKVFYTWSQASGIIRDKDFGLERQWDIDLLSGYDHEFVENISSTPGSHHFNGIVNPTLIKQVEAFSPDAIIVYGWKFNSHLKLMRHLHSKVPIIFRGDSTLLDEAPGFSFKKLFRFTILKWVYRHVDIVFSPGRSSDAYFQVCGLRDDQIFRVPHAIDNDRFMTEDPPDEPTDKKSYTQQALEWRRSLGIADDHKVFLFAGKLEPKKDPELLVCAFFKLLQQRQDIHLIMVGSGILEDKLKQLVTDLTNSLTPDVCRLSSDSCRLTSDSCLLTSDSCHLTSDSCHLTSYVCRLNSYVSFIPFQNQSNMPIVYRMADVFVLPSKGPGETWGLAVNEVMACGRPVIVSDKCGSATDMINEGINGSVFKATHLESLHDTMNSILDADRSSFGEASKKYVQQFSYSSFKDALNVFWQTKKMQAAIHE